MAMPSLAIRIRNPAPSQKLVKPLPLLVKTRIYKKAAI
jgi:hypothetical protein